MSQSTTAPLAGRYELRRQLATTPAARVYLAQDLELGRPVAIKVLGPDLARDPQVVQKFRQAANVAASVHDPRIVAIYDTGEDKGAVYVAMEYVEGASLADTLRDARRLGIAPTINMGASVAQALDAAHRAGLVHGSLKPRDVLMGRDGTVKVTDFGTATAGLASLAGPVSGATYSAPEQLQGGAPDARSDLYALGTLLYESVTGTPPFTGADAVAITQRKLSERVIPPSAITPGIPPGFDAIVDRLLERDPARRYTNGNEVATDLIRLGETAQVPLVDPTMAVPPVAATAVAPVVAPPVPPDEDDEKKRSATPWIIAAIVILALVVGGLVAYSVTQNDDNQAELVLVPAVVGSRVADASATLDAAGLSPSTQNEPSDSFAEGIVFEQSPKAGLQARKGSVVVIKVSAGPTSTTTSSTSSTSTSSTTTSTTSTTSTTTTTAPPDTTPST